jgi:hypothetical protein
VPVCFLQAVCGTTATGKTSILVLEKRLAARFGWYVGEGFGLKSIGDSDTVSLLLSQAVRGTAVALEHPLPALSAVALV